MAKAKDSASSKLLDFRQLLPEGVLRKIVTPINQPLEKTLGITHLNESYRKVQEDQSDTNFYAKAQRALNISYEVSDEDLARIPQEGPIIVVTNHPFGGVDGVAFGALLGTVRPDFKVMANYLLAHMKEIEPWLVGVDPFERKSSARFNFAAMKETIRFLRDGGCLGIFPSGTVSHWQWKQRQITDPQWSSNVARLVHKTQATVVPVFFEGQNSWQFQLAGLVHELLRTILLPREMMKASGSTLRIRIGTAIPYRKLCHYEENAKLTDFLRLNTYLLKRREDTAPKKHFHLPSLPKKTNELQAIVDPVEPDILEEEVANVPEEQLLAEHGNFVVYYAFAEQIPNILDEIGRLREKTFREVGEGTGEPTDLDRFDVYYRHLFMWDRGARKIVGSYRFGATDEIMLTRGQRGLYTSTLFKFKPNFLEKMGPALEMGRSFIVSEYQKKHASLLLLWRGIGEYLVRNPRYKILFGPVSISKEYNAISKDLMVKFLKQERFDENLSSLVKAKNPPRGGPRLRGTEKQALLKAVHNIDDISALVSEIETDHKGIPTLLRHYLKMNGQLLSFNVDEEFGHCVDGLIVVDMSQSDRRLLKSYLGAKGHLSFLKYHGVEVKV
ncbi:lysophospholipid acyltransferase family protein [Rubellicoccus peritrichatus]|uniref:Lysophospholipid acyltransferase family protein n=1 Tax=Rubellicoccus peritrichatus TaxID=3080537 RepID=A0AAQ3QWX8_9BACT|nr:lysophospholipid acyltransferase family protein [Puniceicoccus sp. CR14]WOO42392.1 lysophospholipid acyltransferase family protein [Puniceicoccus sp. CR14]